MMVSDYTHVEYGQRKPQPTFDDGDIVAVDDEDETITYDYTNTPEGTKIEFDEFGEPTIPLDSKDWGEDRLLLGPQLGDMNVMNQLHLGKATPN